MFNFAGFSLWYDCPDCQSDIVSMIAKGLSEHDAAVAQIAQCVREFYEKKTHFRLYHGHTVRDSSLARRF